MHLENFVKLSVRVAIFVNVFKIVMSKRIDTFMNMPVKPECN